jgi:broad specificity phosphatase PhoE
MKHTIETLLPEDFRESLLLIPKDKPVSLLTRHSIREEPENFNAHYKLPLTQDGIALANYWGELQPFSNFQLFSSPVGRCIETAHHMHSGKYDEQGHEEKSQVQEVSVLAEPGCFIEDISIMKNVGKVFVEHGPIPFINKMISGSFEEHLSVKAGVKKLLEHIKMHQTGQSLEQLNIHVSHDTILAALVYSLLKQDTLKDGDWPRMMEGVYLWFDESHVFGVWRGQLFDIALHEFFK